MGKNDLGQLGNGSSKDNNTPVKVMNDVVSVSTGPNNAMAIKKDNTLWSWGYNNYGIVGDGTKDTKYTPVKIMDSVAAVSVGEHKAAAIKTDGSLWAWGDKVIGQLAGFGTDCILSPTKVMDYVAAVNVVDSTMIIRTDGSLWGCGSNQWGELGDDMLSSQTHPIQLMTGINLNTAIVPIPATLSHTLTTSEVVANTKYISASYNNTFVIKQDGSLWGWGNNVKGSLETDKKTYAVKPVKIMSGVSTVSAQEGFNIAMKTDGTLWAWGYMSGVGSYGISYGDKPVKIMSGVSKISATDDHVMVIKTDGTLWGWGSNYSGQLGDGTTKDRTEPVKSISSVTSIGVGDNYTVAIKKDGSLWYFGNITGIDNKNQTKPIKIMDSVVSLSAGYRVFMAIKKDATLWTMGGNPYGSMGIGTSSYSLKPVKIMSNVAYVNTKKYNSLAIKKDGTLWTWGNNSVWQIGDGTNNHRTKPFKVMNDVAYAVYGDYYIEALKKDGTLWAWGNNNLGQIGDGTNSNASTPVKIMDGAVYVDTGDRYTVALKADGSLWSWATDIFYNRFSTTRKTNNPTKIISNVKMDSTAKFNNDKLGTGAEDRDPHTTPANKDSVKLSTITTPTPTPIPTSSAPSSQTQEQAMEKYITKQGSISYKGENYYVYLLNNNFNVYTKRDNNFNLITYQATGKLSLFNEVYFDKKGNFVTDQKTYIDLRKLYLMATCKDGMLVDKKYNGTIIPGMIFGKTLTKISGKAGFTAILTKNPASIGRALTDELKSGAIDQTFASIIWASNEWYGNSIYEGIKKSLDSLYDTKTGIAVIKNNNGIYTISDNYNSHKSLTVGTIFSNWMTTYNRYSVFLNDLDNLDLTVQGGDTIFDTATGIIKDVGDIFLSALSEDVAKVVSKNKTVSSKVLKALMKKYVDLNKVNINFNLNDGLQISNTKKDFYEGIVSLFDNALSFKTTYQNRTKENLTKFEDAADITIGRQDASSVEEHISNVVEDKKFKMPKMR